MGCDFRVSLEGALRIGVCMIQQGGGGGEGGDDGNRETAVAQQGGVEKFVDDGDEHAPVRQKKGESKTRTRTWKGKALDFLFRPPEGLWAAATKACGAVDWTSKVGVGVGEWWEGANGRIAAVVLLFKSFQKVRREILVWECG